MLLISRTKADGAPAGNNLIKWLLKHEQIVPKKKENIFIYSLKIRRVRKN